MQKYPRSLNILVNEFNKLPGIGNVLAQRLAFHVLSLSDAEAEALADAIVQAKHTIKYCSVCGNLTESDPCDICKDESRSEKSICVVESPRDVVAMEKVKAFTGKYHVLHGTISPMQGIGPEDINLQSLIVRLQNSQVEEVIVATNPTLEGEATAMYIARLIKPSGIKVTRLAHGIPIGADVAYADEETLLKALEGRTEV